MTKTPAGKILDKLKRNNMDQYTKEEWGELCRAKGYDQGFEDGSDLHRQTLEAVDLILHGASEKIYRNYD